MSAADDTTPRDGEPQAKTVLFADIASSTEILGRLGEVAGRELIVRCLAAMTEVVESSGGEVVDRIGDELFCFFPEPDAAAHGASQLQQRVVDGHTTGDFECPMRIRIGFEHGEVTAQGGEMYGTTIHTAKRLVDLAKPSQILTTQTTLDQLGPLRRRMERYVDTVILKGLAQEQDIHELLWDTSVTMVPTGRPRRRRQTTTQSVELRYGETTIRIDAARPRVTIGRDAACQLRLMGNAVSRVHARLIWNRGKVQVEDVSTNGTSVETACGTVTTLHHDGVELQGRGFLRCGCLGPEEDAALVEYECESGE